MKKLLFSGQLLIVFTLFSSLVVSCQTGNLTVITSVPSGLKEVSALEVTSHSDLFWMIEDAGNDNKLYGLDAKGNIKKALELEGVKNDDWEDITSDEDGNIYIGDFGNNSKSRKTFSIFKIAKPHTLNKTAKASRIVFRLPSDMKSKDFEAFFILNNNFYIFSKENKKGVVIKVPNKLGVHEASLVSTYKLKGKKTKITGADISTDQKTVVLLNHDRLWKLTNFSEDQFFSGSVSSQDFDYDTQKEGICFKDETTIYISDERKKNEGGLIYSFTLK